MASVQIEFEEKAIISVKVIEDGVDPLALIKDFKEKYSKINSMMDNQLLSFDKDENSILVMPFVSNQTYKTRSGGIGQAVMRFLSACVDNGDNEGGASFGVKPFKKEFYEDLYKLLFTINSKPIDGEFKAEDYYISVVIGYSGYSYEYYSLISNGLKCWSDVYDEEEYDEEYY